MRKCSQSLQRSFVHGFQVAKLLDNKFNHSLEYSVTRLALAIRCSLTSKDRAYLKS
jgi:hypothetical protein